MFNTGKQFKDTFKNRIYLRFYEVFNGWSQWFINHCDMEPIDYTKEEIEQFITLSIKNFKGVG